MPAAAAATTWAWWCISSRSRMPWTTSTGSGRGMQVASPPYSKARNKGPSSSQSPSRLVVGRGDGTAEKSGARKGFASWRAVTVTGTTRRDAGEVGVRAGLRLGLRFGLAARPEEVVLQAHRGGRDHGASASSSSSEVSRTAVLARIVAIPSSRVNTAARSASGAEVSAFARARSSHQEGDDLVCRAAARPDLAALRGGLDLTHRPGQDRDDASSLPARERRRSRDGVRGARYGAKLAVPSGSFS